MYKVYISALVNINSLHLHYAYVHCTVINLHKFKTRKDLCLLNNQK